jgi:hypothetical protein
LAQQLQKLTGDLAVSPDRSGELDRARRLLARSILGGPQQFQDSRTAPRLVETRENLAEPSEELQQIADEETLAFREGAVGGGVQVRLRDAPAAMGAVQETIGPFFARNRRRVWFDLLAPPMANPIFVIIGAGSVFPFLILPNGVTKRDSLTFDLPEGSIWINAGGLHPAAPFGQYMGMRITSGAATFTVAPDVVGNTLRVSPAASLVLELDPEPSVAPSNFDPPSKARMTFNADVLNDFSAETATISAFGATVEISPVGLPVFETGDLTFSGGLTVLNTKASIGANSIQLDGDWTVNRAVWVFPLQSVNVTAPPQANSAGTGALQAGPGVNLSWTGRRAPVPLATVSVVAAPTFSSIFAIPASSGGRQTILDEGGATLGELRFDNLTQIFVSSDTQPVSEYGLQGSCSGTLTPASPVYADGAPIRIDAKSGTLSIIELPDETSINLFLIGDPIPDRKAVALSNAILTVSAPSSGTLQGDLLPSGSVAESIATFRFSLLGVLPTLADPYASNFEPVPRVGQPIDVEVSAQQVAGGAPRAGFFIPDILNPAEPLSSWMPEPGNDFLNFIGDRSSTKDVARQAARSTTHWLLDVSTNSDQFGVAIGSSVHANASVRDGELQWDGLDMLVFTVPAIQWEPVSDSTGALLLSTDDGGPSAFAVDTVHLVPVAPIAAVSQLIDEYRNGTAGHASITLPFGIRASVFSTDPNGAGPHPLRPGITLDRASFPGFDTARQIRMTAASPSGILGAAQQTNNIPQSPFKPDTNVLQFREVPVIDTMFNAVFHDNFSTATVPVQRYDLSGFGASVFSQWRNPNQLPPNVSQVQFDVLTGRTSHEVVQVSAILWPCQAFLVRTITLERENSAAVVRHDSGWIASSDGVFQMQAGACPFHPGVVSGYFNIREIRDTPRILNAADAQLQAVYFDADVEVAGVVKGHRDGRVPVQRHAGYVQFMPIGTGLSAIQLADLLRQEGPIGGALDCEIDIAGSGNRMLANSMSTQVTMNPGNSPEFVVAVNGRPVFPATGSWSAVSTNKAGQTAAVDPQAGVPLIRQGLATTAVRTEPHRFADPADLFQRIAPETEYGFLFSTGSSRTLLPSPELKIGDSKLTSLFGARVADPSVVAISNGIFPKADTALHFPSNYALDFSGGPTVLDQKSATRAKELELVSTKVMRLYVESSAGFDTLINATDWKVDSTEQTIFLDLLSFKKILSFRGTWLTNNLGERKLQQAKMDLSQDLEPIKDVLDLLNKLHLQDAIEFSLRTIGSGTLALDISVEGHLAKDDGSRIEVGLGKLSGMLRMGVVIRASITDGIQGDAFLEVSGDFQQAIIPEVLYAGGFLKFRIGIDQDGKAILELNVGVVGSIGGDLIPGLVEVEGTAKYGYVMVLPELDAGQIRLGATVGMEVRAKLLSGLVGIKFGFEAGAAMGLDPGNSNLVIITVQIMVSASVTAAWIFRARVSFHAEYETKVPKLLAAATLALTGAGVGPAAALAAA